MTDQMDAELVLKHLGVPYTEFTALHECPPEIAAIKVHSYSHAGIPYVVMIQDTEKMLGFMQCVAATCEAITRIHAEQSQQVRFVLVSVAAPQMPMGDVLERVAAMFSQLAELINKGQLNPNVVIVNPPHFMGTMAQVATGLMGKTWQNVAGAAHVVKTWDAAMDAFNPKAE